jgi:putative PEP-CTERM system TPR-repeat lipoprotein
MAAYDKASRYYEDAVARLDKKDTGGAIVQLKNALQQDPNMLAAQMLLGRAYLDSAQPQAAQESFEKAIRLGVHPSEVAVPLAQAMLEQGQEKEMLARFPPESARPDQRAEMLVLRGHAYKLSDDVRSAFRSFEDARAADPKYFPALRSLIELYIQEGGVAEASKLSSEGVRLAPSDSKAWFLKGLTSQSAGDVPSAIAEYGRAVEANPADYDARRARASLLLALNRDKDAIADIDQLTRDNGKDPRTLYLRATYLSRKGDRKGEREALTEITQELDSIRIDVLERRAPHLLLLGALSHDGLGALERARTYLERYLRAEPGNIDARKLLASILLSQRDSVRALQVLEAAQKRAPNDPELHAMMAGAYTGKQRPELAIQHLEKALTLSGSAPQVQATLGMSLVKTGQVNLGVDHLRRAFDKDPRLVHVGVALALLYVRQGNPQQAIEVAQKVVQRSPNDASTLNLLGVARVATGDRKGGRAAYEQAIKADRAFTPAQLNLGKLDLMEGNDAAARERFLAILSDRPKDAQAMYELAKVEDSVGHVPEAIRWLEKARTVNRRNIPAAVYLVDVYLRAGQAKNALEVAKDAEAVAPQDLNVLAALGRAYLAHGDDKLAQEVFTRMGTYAGADPQAQYGIAEYQLRANNPQGAAASLAAALAAKPDFMPAQELLASIEVRRGQFDTAMARAKSIVARYPQQSGGYRLLGDIALARGNVQEALAQFQVALGKEPTTENAMRVFQVYLRSGSLPKATQFIDVWLRDHPTDGTALRALADAQFKAGDLKSARRRYEAIVETQGEDANVLNNLASILAKQGDAKALAYAERAFQLAPASPPIQDTLGWLLVQRGLVDVGLRHIRDASLRDPSNPEIRYHLAAALAKTGREKEARSELAIARAQNGSFDGIEDARRLASDLRK